MNEPKRYDYTDLLAMGDINEGFYNENDPALAEMKRKAEALDKLEEMARNKQSVNIELKGNKICLDPDIIGKHGEEILAPNLLTAIEAMKETK